MLSPSNDQLICDLDDIAARCEETPTSLCSAEDETFEDLKKYLSNDFQCTNEAMRSDIEPLTSLPGYDAFEKTSELLGLRIGGPGIKKSEQIHHTMKRNEERKKIYHDEEANTISTSAGEAESKNRGDDSENSLMNLQISPSRVSNHSPPAIGSNSCNDHITEPSKCTSQNDIGEKRLDPAQDIIESDVITDLFQEEVASTEREALEAHIARDKKRRDLKVKRHNLALKERNIKMKMTRSAQLIQLEVKKLIERKKRRRLNKCELTVSKFFILYEARTLKLSFQRWLAYSQMVYSASLVIQRVVKSYIIRRVKNRREFASKINVFVYQYHLRKGYELWKDFHSLTVKREKDSSAIIVQCAMRVYFAKRILQRSVSAVLRIETFWRKENAKKRYRRAQNEQKEEIGSIKIKKDYRGHKLRKQIRMARCNVYSYIDSELDHILRSGAETLLGDILEDQQTPWIPELPKLPAIEKVNKKAMDLRIELTSENHSDDGNSLTKSRNCLENGLAHTESLTDCCYENDKKSSSHSHVLMREWNLKDERIVRVSRCIIITTIRSMEFSSTY